MNRVEDYRPKIDWRFLTEPKIGLNERIGGLANPVAAFVEPVLNTPVQELPECRHAYHAGNVAVLNRACESITSEIGQISDLCAATERRQKTGGEFKRVMQW